MTSITLLEPLMAQHFAHPSFPIAVTLRAGNNIDPLQPDSSNLRKAAVESAAKPESLVASTPAPEISFTPPRVEALPFVDGAQLDLFTPAAVSGPDRLWMMGRLRRDRLCSTLEGDMRSLLGGGASTTDD